MSEYERGYRDGFRAATPTHCKDCKHYEREPLGVKEPRDEWGLCSRLAGEGLTVPVVPDGFCAWGERKVKG